MGKKRRILLGATIVGLGLGGALFYDSLPPPKQNIPVERSGQSSGDNYFDALHLRIPVGYEKTVCDNFLIITSLKRLPTENRGWDYAEGEIDLQLSLDCKEIPLWHGDLQLGAFGKEPKGKTHLTGEVGLSVVWEEGGRRDIGIGFEDIEKIKNSRHRDKEVVPASTFRFNQSIPSVAQASITVNFSGHRDSSSHDYDYFNGYYPGFSIKTKLPLKEGREESVDWQRARAEIEKWLYESSGIAVNGTVPLRQVSQDAYEGWFSQKVNSLMIEKVDRYKDRFIENIQFQPTEKNLQMTVKMSNTSFTEGITIGESIGASGFYLTHVLDSTGRVIKRYEEPFVFPIDFGTRDVAPQYSATGTGIINKPHHLPDGAKYYLGELKIGHVYNISSPTDGRWLRYTPLIVDLENVPGKLPFNGRLGIRGVLLRIKDSIQGLFD